MRRMVILLSVLSIFTQSIIAQTYVFSAYKYCCVGGDTSGIKVNIKIIVNKQKKTIHILSNPDKIYDVAYEADSAITDSSGSSCIILTCYDENTREHTILYIERPDGKHALFLIISDDIYVEEYYAIKSKTIHNEYSSD